MAGFEVFIDGRFWVFTEEKHISTSLRPEDQPDARSLDEVHATSESSHLKLHRVKERALAASVEAQDVLTWS